ncbi:MAG TPA: N-acyl homoserine lactonase family protein [Candidatus Acidoferrales bacterium]|nr:N-acyl homoserine lactonase family protein [Candidatus Acidoferrales bacterium]
MKRLILTSLFAFSLATLGYSQGAAPPAPEYSIEAIRYATLPQFPVSALVMGAPKDEKLDIAMVIWLVRGGGHTILVDSGFHREKWFKLFPMKDYMRPDEAVAQGGVKPEDLTDIIITHGHWDHMGGIDLFPRANIWLQRQEFQYYVDESFQSGGGRLGVDSEDLAELVRIAPTGRVHLVDGDDVEILPGIRVYTGARHTYASQYVRVAGTPPFVLASDNCYLYRNLDSHAAGGTFSGTDRPANIKAQERMVQLAGAKERVVPGHDALQFERFPSSGRIAKIK